MFVTIDKRRQSGSAGIRHEPGNVVEPQWFINDFEGLIVAATHGSPWRYDTHVPIVFVGSGIAARHVERKVLTIDVAPTLAALLGIDRPSGATGAILIEVMGTGPH